MPQRTSALAPALLVLWACGWIFFGTGGCGVPVGTAGCSPFSPVNVALDSDGDGLPDLVTVGDFDGDGVREMDDLQDAVDALTDLGPKVVNVLAGDYVAPAAPALRAGRTHAILELRSHTTLSCAGVGSTVLNAPAPGAGRDYAVVGNDDHCQR